MYKYGSKLYPDSVETILRDKAFSKVLFSFLQSETNHENLIFYMAPFKPKFLYETFIAEGSKMEVNLSYAEKKPARDLAEKAAADPLMWKHPDWVDAIQTCRQSAYSNLYDPMMRFWRSEHFKRYHLKNGGRLEELKHREEVDNPAPPPAWELAAEHFQFKDANAMRVYIAAFERNGEDKTLGAAAKLLRSEGNTLNAHIFNKLLISQGFAKKPAGFDAKPTPPSTDGEDETDALPELVEEGGKLKEQLVDVSNKQITLAPRNLQKCGFQEVKKTKNVELIKDVVRAHLAKDRQEAMRLYIQLLKLEPKNKPLQQTPYVDMMKKMREQKAYTVGEAT